MTGGGVLPPESPGIRPKSERPPAVKGGLISCSLFSKSNTQNQNPASVHCDHLCGRKQPFVESEMVYYKEGWSTLGKYATELEEKPLTKNRLNFPRGQATCWGVGGWAPAGGRRAVPAAVGGWLARRGRGRGRGSERCAGGQQAALGPRAVQWKGLSGLCLTSVPCRVGACEDHSGGESESQVWIDIPSP